MSEYIPRSHAVISPGVQQGTLTGFERKGLIQDGEPVGKREVSMGPGLSTESCTHSLPRSCVEGYVVQLSEARSCVDDG